MKKILTLIAGLFLSAGAYAQVVINHDTVTYNGMPKDGFSHSLKDSITNNTGAAASITYNISSMSLLQGWSGKGICDKNSCWSFDQTPHTFTLNPGETAQVYVDMSALPTGADGISTVTVTTNFGQMVYRFISWPNAIKDVDNNPLVNMFPNPANAYVNFTVLDNRVAQVYITNVVGKRIMSQDLRNSGNTVRVALDHVSDGIYMVQMADAKGQILGVKRLTVK
ncbi:MAG: T9SS type A sorting domain-containing protein [Chitinophagaceae bacterium]